MATPTAMDKSRPSFAIVLPTIYGHMIVNRHDTNQTNALLKTGGAIDHAEIGLLQQILTLLGTDRWAIDVGANFGTYTLAFASVLRHGRGQVHAFEAQRILFNMVCGSVALNGLLNVHCHNIAVGDRAGEIEIPQFDYSRELNFGSIEFGPRQTERLSQERGRDPASIEHVPMRTIDSYGFDNVGLMKIDVEGMEMPVLEGARHTIERCRPVLFVEFLKSDKAALFEWLRGRGYAIHALSMNFLCIPAELADRIQIQAG